MKGRKGLYSAYSVGRVEVDFVVDSIHQLLFGFDDVGGGFIEQTSQCIRVNWSIVVCLCVRRCEESHFDGEEECRCTDRFGVVLKNAACDEKALDVGCGKYLDGAVVDLAVRIARVHFEQLGNEMVQKDALFVHLGVFISRHTYSNILGDIFRCYFHLCRRGFVDGFFVWRGDQRGR